MGEQTRMNGQPMLQMIPCAVCRTNLALRECEIRTTAFGLGEITVYLCQKDYDAMLEKQQGRQVQNDDKERQRERFEQIRLEIAARGLCSHGGQWPPRQALWDALKKTEQHHNEARAAYRRADDSTSEGYRARLRVLRQAGLCLFDAICIEAAAALEGTGDSAVSGTLSRVTSAFLRTGGFTVREKQLTQPQVYAAMQAVLRFRETQLENEEEELAAIDHEMTRGDV